MTWGMSAAHMDDKGRNVGAAKGNTPDERRRATRTVAALAQDAVEAAEFLGALGLSAVEGLQPVGGEAA